MNFERNFFRSFFCVVTVSLFAAACGSSSSGNGQSPVYDAGAVDDSLATEQVSGACIDPATSKAPVTSGGTCLVATDCKPVCCKCTGGTKSWTAQVCKGTCADQAAACDATKDDAKFCN